MKKLHDYIIVLIAPVHPRVKVARAKSPSEIATVRTT